MSNQNIKIGIDLGTTNSEVAVSKGGTVEIVKNIFGDEYTPSVFGVDKAGNKVVGKKAYERLFKDSSPEEFKNNKAEVKRLMGTSDTVHFERLGKDMTAEEISAEILKSLKEDVVRKHPGFDTRAAVITIPAYFSALQAEATKRAGTLAGFEHVVLLQEPIAAAISYGFMNAKDENWLVYDLGGGTFDVALISSKEGSLSVLGQNGDNFLGGKDFDNLIVDKVIVPKLLEGFNLSDFDRNNPEYRSVFAKLKYYAEQAKVYLSQYDSYTIEVENIGTDTDGKEIYTTVEISRSEFEELIRPLVDRTINLASKTIVESGIKPASVHKVILVGGPTQIPYIRQRLEQKLQIEIDTSADPLTAVARGACIFATSQRIPQELSSKDKPAEAGTKTLTLYYDSLTSEDEESVSGVVNELKDSDEEYYIQIQSDSGHYGGTKLKLNKGKFFDTVTIEPQKENLFWIYLFDKQGNAVPMDPDSFSITHGLSVS
ncbi:MAG: Hsp70 family protein, partial [bacterium]